MWIGFLRCLPHLARQTPRFLGHGGHLETLVRLTPRMIRLPAWPPVCCRDNAGTLTRQLGVFRTNCIDTLDRTNVVQVGLGPGLGPGLGLRNHSWPGQCHPCPLDGGLGSGWAGVWVWAKEDPWPRKETKIGN